MRTKGVQASMAAMPSALNLSDLIDIIQLKNRALSPEMVEAAVRRIFVEIRKALAGGARVEIRGFGVLEVRQYQALDSRDPRTGAPVHVPAKKGVRWKTGKGLAKAINEPPAEQQEGARQRA